MTKDGAQLDSAPDTNAKLHRYEKAQTGEPRSIENPQTWEWEWWTGNAYWPSEQGYLPPADGPKGCNVSCPPSPNRETKLSWCKKERKKKTVKQ